MRVVVTGASGFIGRHLVEEFARRGGDVIEAWTHRACVGDWDAKVKIAAIDIVDRDAIVRHLTSFAPDLIVHLAAQSLPGRSWAEPVPTYQTNVLGAIHLLEAIRGLAKQPRVLLAGSSAEYADAADACAIIESARTEPNSPYGTSKLAVDQLAQLYVRRYDLDLVRFRPFFLVGPRKIGDVCSDFARRVVAIEQGQQSTIRVGSLDVVRDIMDVRDGISGISRIATAGKRGEVYNLSSGRGVRIGDILETYRRLAAVPFAVVPDPMLMRPLEQRVRIGDSSKLRSLGWKPEHSLASTLQSVLDYWRSVGP
jgi:GDP-4-dehydro-6-deoxy-D-mannose reductase